jgi:hypothetical protein
VGGGVLNLLELAIVGTSKIPDGRQIPMGVAGPLLSNPSLERESALLLAAGVEAVYRLAGALPCSGVQVPEPAPDETRVVCSPSVASLLAEMLAGEYAAVLPEAARFVAERNGRIPPAILPRVLDVIDGGARRALRPILGERARWLARFNPRWSWVLAEVDAESPLPNDAERVWEEGTLVERRAILEHARSADPARGRTLLEMSFAKEKAEQRAAFLEQFATGLSLDDESFVEECTSDRSSAVRAAGAELLCRLQGSRLSTRMIGRADALLTYTHGVEPKGLLARMKSLVSAGSSGVVEIEPPRSLDADAERDGIPKKPPQGVGERAFWLAEILARVPPNHWTSRFACSAAELVNAVRDSEWREAVLLGFRDAAIRFESAEWASAVWDEAVKREADSASAARLLALLPASELESRALSLLRDPSSMPAYTPQLLARVPAPWSQEFSHRYVTLTRALVEKALRGEEPPLVWRATLPAAAAALLSSALDAPIAEWAAPDGDSEAREPPWARDLSRFNDVLSFRRRFHEALERWPR